MDKTPSNFATTTLKTGDIAVEKLVKLVAAFPEIFERHEIVLDKNGLPVFVITIKRSTDDDTITTTPKLPIESDEFDLIVSVFYEDESCEIVLTERGISKAKVNGVDINGNSRETRVLQLFAISSTIRFGGNWLTEALKHLPYPEELGDRSLRSIPATNPFADLVRAIFDEMVEARTAEYDHQSA